MQVIQHNYMTASAAIAYTATDTLHNIVIGDGTLKLAVIKQMPPNISLQSPTVTPISF